MTCSGSLLQHAQTFSTYAEPTAEPLPHAGLPHGDGT